MNKQILCSYDESELRTLIFEVVIEALQDHNLGKAPIKKHKPIKGIHELAKFLGVSPSRAQKLKKMMV
ncbi:hypothetical protein ACFLQ5_01935 [Bacteroidota bacterium]